MTRSIILAGLLAAALAGCARTATPPVAPEAATDFAGTSGFVPYCGPLWSVTGQGYRYVPCPPGSHYEGAAAR
jgi:hypothetical protein